MSGAEACDVCGFEWEAIGANEIVPRLISASDAFAVVLGENPACVTMRPEPGRWSALEYGAHVRDVIINVRDRIFVGLAEANPVTKPMYRDLRIPFYASEAADGVAAELAFAAALFVRTFAGLASERLARTLVYAYPRESLSWMSSRRTSRLIEASR